MKLPPLHAHPDLTVVRALLTAAGLPTADLVAALRADFWGCHEGTNLIGVIGLETYGAVALLRSLAVAPDWQGRGLGTTLLAHAEQTARQRGVSALYLLTTTAEASFTRRGYVRLPREAAPQNRVETYAWLLLAAEQGERDALDLEPDTKAGLSDAELQRARDRALRYRQGSL